MKSITIDQLLTPAELERAMVLYRQLAHMGRFAATLDAEIITPNIERMNKVLGQENNPRYLAYAVEFVLSQVIKNGEKNGN